MTGLAALPMYDWPEIRADTDRWWQALRTAAAGYDLPSRLSRPTDAAALHKLWRDPALRFSQTCWGPLRAGLAAAVRVLAQPDYSDVPGGRGPFYRSVLLTRATDAAALDIGPVPVPPSPRAALPHPPQTGRRLAANAAESLSGHLALIEDWQAPPAALGLAVVWTGSHRASLQAVAGGRADCAAIDCRSWALAQRFEPAAAALTAIGWTAERAGLPYITSRHTAPEIAGRLQDILLGWGCHRPEEGRTP